MASKPTRKTASAPANRREQDDLKPRGRIRMTLWEPDKTATAYDGDYISLDVLTGDVYVHGAGRSQPECVPYVEFSDIEKVTWEALQ